MSSESSPGAARIAREAGAAGLRLAGLLDLDAYPEHAPGDAGALALLGSSAGAFWSGFEAWSVTHEQPPGAKHDPLDRYTRWCVEPLAQRLGLRAIYPFEGPPFWPFQQWAMCAEAVHVSPLKILIHPELGLWHAYRAALLLERMPADSVVSVSAPSPCDTCEGRPCLRACPVKAFADGGYDVEACAAFVRADETCRAHGCRARQACPVGHTHQYARSQQRFHLRAFVAARRS